MSHGTHMDELCLSENKLPKLYGTHMNESWHTHEQVMAQKWISHGTHVNESLHTHEWVMAHTRMSHAWVRINYGSSDAHIWMSPGTHTNESWHTHKWVVAHTRMSHGTHTTESWHTHDWAMAHTRMHYAWVRINCRNSDTSAVLLRCCSMSE